MRKVLLGLLFVSGCGIPGFTSSMRDNHFPPNALLELKCENYGRDADELNDMGRKYYPQGYRLAYITEYTSSARPGYPSVACFERAVSVGAAPAYPQQ